MQGSDTTTGSLFSYVDAECRMPAQLAASLATLDAEFGNLYAGGGRPSTAPDKLLRAR